MIPLLGTNRITPKTILHQQHSLQTPLSTYHHSMTHTSKPPRINTFPTASSPWRCSRAKSRPPRTRTRLPHLPHYLTPPHSNGRHTLTRETAQIALRTPN